ncbi:MAG: 2TM domain-containing protein [Elainellaceae cyanobacterium]
MPPRWPRQPDRKDPAFRRLDDRMTFATHVAIFAATNSGLWFFRLVNFPTWTWVGWVTPIWLAALVGHGVYVFAIADYSQPQPQPTKPKGFAKDKSSS